MFLIWCLFVHYIRLDMRLLTSHVAQVQELFLFFLVLLLKMWCPQSPGDFKRIILFFIDEGGDVCPVRLLLGGSLREPVGSKRHTNERHRSVLPHLSSTSGDRSFWDPIVPRHRYIQETDRLLGGANFKASFSFQQWNRRGLDYGRRS